MKQNSKTYDIIRYIVLGVAVVVFLVAAGMLIHIFMEYKKGTDIYENISSSVLTPVDKPTGDGTDTSSDEEEAGKSDSPNALLFRFLHRPFLLLPQR